jgi:hypothetical protein
MRHFKSSVLIEAPVTSVWPILADIERWPTWADSFSVVQKLDNGETGIGTKVRIKQPKLSAGDWEIIEWVDGRSFKWVSSRFGLTVTGDHILLDEGPQCMFHQSLKFEGLLSFPTATLGKNLIEPYMASEAIGLKRIAEQSFGKQSGAERLYGHM